MGDLSSDPLTSHMWVVTAHGGTDNQERSKVKQVGAHLQRLGGQGALRRACPDAGGVVRARRHEVPVGQERHVPHAACAAKQNGLTTSEERTVALGAQYTILLVGANPLCSACS